jgi:hypothetical protein
VPFGFVPLKTDRADPPDGAGAGAGKVSLPVPTSLVGWNVPETSGPLSGSAKSAASSSVRLTLMAGTLPPTSDMIMAFCPLGPTSRMSISSGKV